MKKTLIALLGFALLSVPITATAQQYGDFTYTSTTDRVTITGYTGAGGAVSIPGTVNGLHVTSIGDNVFKNSQTLTSATVPSGVTSIGDSAFYTCTKLTSVTLPPTLTTIVQFAFANCFILTNISIPASVTNIGLGALCSCDGLSGFPVDPGNPFYFEQDGVLFQRQPLTLVQCPAGKAGSYSIPEGVTSIEGWAFNGCLYLTDVTIPDSVTTIGAAAFAYCQGLTNVFFTGNAPALTSTIFDQDRDPTVSYIAGKTGWSSTFGGVSATPLQPRAATATATVVNGFLVGASLTDAGLGYTNTPLVRIIGGGGSGARAVAVVSNEVVVAINVLAAGSGYTNTPVVVVEPPFIPRPIIGISAIVYGPLVSPVIQLSLSNLAPYDNYQLQFCPAARGAWTNLGTPFIPTASTNTQYATAIGNVGFFRVQYVP